MKPRKLLEHARKAMANAYCPYSKYRVGAALLTQDGHVFLGCNVENASLGLTLCAERSAIAAAVSSGHRHFAAIAIVASGKKMPYPCGACRQTLAEFRGRNLMVYVARRASIGTFEEYRLADLLPKSFGL